ncbi:hypothetical protein BN11_3690001 [Nostocoides australiense Ben110]|uniref:Uncharacterized protein n=1 Tax=Nostocoides australiense Ben110 TaxID=1193182 RepID=W6JY37_9MICO|nr:hypothetical protein BN11_3690001 [Tetrasphaera australiensis Ben110]
MENLFGVTLSASNVGEQAVEARIGGESLETRIGTGVINGSPGCQYLRLVVVSRRLSRDLSPSPFIGAQTRSRAHPWILAMCQGRNPPRGPPA